MNIHNSRRCGMFFDGLLSESRHSTDSLVLLYTRDERYFFVTSGVLL